jgi:hypothetical protein
MVRRPLTARGGVAWQRNWDQENWGFTVIDLQKSWDLPMETLDSLMKNWDLLKSWAQRSNDGKEHLFLAAKIRFF